MAFPTALAQNNPDEYAKVIRVDANGPPPRDHDYIDDTVPVHFLQFCRTSTLAQGRILYDVWDSTGSIGWLHPRHVGYLIPSHIAAERRRLTTRHPKDEWGDLGPPDGRIYQDTWDAVVQDWPGIPMFGARKVVERMVRARAGLSSSAVEDGVVRYAMRNWTNYWLRMGGVGGEDPAREAEVRRAVAPRLRQVLKEWMWQGVRMEDAERLFERHGLLDEVTSMSYAQPARSKYFS